MIRALLAAAFGSLVILIAWPAAAQPKSAYGFQMGFAALAAQIPAIAGQPVEEEHYGPNGDSLQKTTTGLMVWRKADNWTAFTNGTRTWVNGPLGVQERGNEERFDWEIGSLSRSLPADPPPEVPPTLVSPPPPSRGTTQPTSSSLPRGVRSPEPAGEWVTSVASSSRYYTSKDSAYWRTWAPENRVWFATLADLLTAFPGRTRR